MLKDWKISTNLFCGTEFYPKFDNIYDYVMEYLDSEDPDFILPDFSK